MKPRVFIGSSEEGLPIAEWLQAGLDREVDVTLWNQGPFKPSAGTLKSLDESTREFEFAVLVLTPDDVNYKRGHPSNSPRDNVVFELGLFMGALGPDRTFMVFQQGEPLSLPTDLSGVTAVTYRARTENMEAALGPVCTRIKQQIRRLTPLEPDCTGSWRRVPRRRRRRSLGTACIRGYQGEHGIDNISATGAFLETAGAIQVGKLLDLVLGLEDGTKIQAGAKVVRVQWPQWRRAGGVGVAFTAFDAHSEDVLRKYVEAELTRDGGGSHDGDIGSASAPGEIR